MESLEVTPKPSPEREIKPTSTPQSDPRRSGSNSIEGSPEAKVKLLTPPKSSSRGGSPREGSPEPPRRQTAVSARLSARGSVEGGEKDLPSASQQQQSDVESSLEYVSKLSEDTISAHSVEDFTADSAHSKTGSEDITASPPHLHPITTITTSPSSSLLPRSTLTTAQTAHLKAASDDITASSAVSTRARSNLMASRSLNNMDKVGVGVHEARPTGPLGSRLPGEGRARVSGSEPPASVGEEVEQEVEHPVKQEGELRESIATVISPTLKMADKDADEAPTEPAEGEEALFDMLKGGDKQVRGTTLAGTEEERGGSQEDLTDSQEVMEEFDRMLESAEEMVTSEGNGATAQNPNGATAQEPEPTAQAPEPSGTEHSDHEPIGPEPSGSEQEPQATAQEPEHASEEPKSTEQKSEPTPQVPVLEDSEERQGKEQDTAAAGFLETVPAQKPRPPQPQSPSRDETDSSQEPLPPPAASDQPLPPPTASDQPLPPSTASDQAPPTFHSK